MNRLAYEDVTKLLPHDLFDYQMEIIKENFPKRIHEAILKQRDILFGKTMRMRMPYGNIYFVPVIPPSGKIGIKELMQMIEHNGEKGIVALNTSRLRDVERTPNELYFMLNVEDGSKTLGKSPRVSERVICEQKRNRLTVVESINLCIFMDVLVKLNIDCTGSRYGNIEVPHICITKNTPTLGKSDLCDANQEWGSPSCTGRHKIQVSS